ncbi:MAG: hypothetical protein EB051_02505 [Chlamydiia bacterium]|nr:hypothetical protein [Chlamydiia bacterium]
MLSENPYIALTYTEYNGKKLDKEIRMHPATLVLNEHTGKFTTQLADNGKSAILTHRDADGKTRSWRVEILGGTDPIGLDQGRADAIAQLFNECQVLQGSLLGKRASEGPLIINTQKSSDGSNGWQWSIPTSADTSPAWMPFKVGAQSQDIFTKLFTNVDASRPQASMKSAHGLSVPTALHSRTPDPKGIPNLGNTCFMNAALQGLLRMPHIGEYLKGLKLAEGSDACQLKRALTVLFDEFQKEEPNSRNIEEAAQMIRNLPTIKGKFNLPQQHDSSEFLMHISKLLGLDSNPRYCIKTQNFAVGSEDKSGVEAAAQPEPIAKPEPSCCVTLIGGNLKSSETKLKIDALLLQNISEHEELEAERAEARLQQTKFTHDNPAELEHLSFLLPRFGINDLKHGGQVTCIFSENLMVPIHQEDTPILSLNFQADSVICHVEGGTRHSGHYVTIVREGSGFKEISDHESRMLTPDQAEDMASKNGYIVNYNRVVSSQGLTSF